MKTAQTIENQIKRHAYFNKKFFAKWAPYYDFISLVIKPIRYHAAGLLALPKNKKVLDVATGTGEQAIALAKKGYDVVGVDLSQEMLVQAMKKTGPKLTLQFIHHDATTLPFSDNSFDASTISFALHDMPHEIRLLVLKEMKRVTKKDGIIMVIDYAQPSMNMIAKFTHAIVRHFETPMYEDFLRRGVPSYLSTMGLSPYKKTLYFLSQISLSKKRKP